MPHVAGGWDVVRQLVADETSGAAEIAHQAAAALGALPRSDLIEAVRTLVRSHPSMAPLWRLAQVALSAEDHGRAVRDFADALRREADGVAVAAAEVLPDRLVTHSYSSTLVAAVAAATDQVWCARSEPGGEGAVTAERLRRRGVEAHLVDDARAITLAADGVAVVVGADAVGPGGVVNKVGTRALADATRRGGASCYLVAGSSKLLQTDLPAPPPFERAPLALFATVITEAGLLDPETAASAAGDHPVPDALRDLI
jgi:translation initiation factor 2B subunit (eIF-2B alpha/beta/delta family)